MTRNPSRIDDLLSRMTLTEKLGQLTMTASGYAVTGPVMVGDSTESIKDGSVGNLLNMVGPGPTREVQQLAIEHSRLGIPLLIGLDVIHGHRILFPLPIAEAAAFDPALWERSAREAAAEAAADGLAMTFAPMLDVSRDPRWGRTAEGAGEDGWLNSRLAEAKVRGFQGRDLADPRALAACAKHFCAYGPVTAGREYAAVDISERSLHEVHLPPFEAAVRAGVATIMPAFTDLNGVPMSAHVPLLRDYLRGTLGFDGVIVSDYNAIGELIRHGVASDLAEAAALALDAGIDIDMMAEAYRKGLPVALERGRVTMEQIDTAVRRVLELKERLGLFDDPYRRGATPEPASALAERRAFARHLAQRCAVLLQNRNAALPLAPATQTLAVLGPLADAASEMCGCWWAAGENEPNTSVLAGLRTALPQAQLRHASGVSISGDDTGGIAAALALCDGAEAVVLCLGEAARQSGEAASRAYPTLPGQQLALASAVFARAQTLGIPVIVVLFSGRPLVIPELAAGADAILAAWFLGTEAGNALADLLTGKVSPSGRSPMTWPRAIGQIPVFFGQRPSGRPLNPDDFFTSQYLDVANSPLFPFGHGLSYAEVRYDDLTASPAELHRDGELCVGVSLHNTGGCDVEETVFLFFRDKVASVTRPLLELRGFHKQALPAGSRERVEFRVPAAAFELLDASLCPAFEEGEIEILVGPSADRERLMSVVVRLVTGPSLPML